MGKISKESLLGIPGKNSGIPREMCKGILKRIIEIILREVPGGIFVEIPGGKFGEISGIISEILSGAIPEKFQDKSLEYSCLCCSGISRITKTPGNCWSN